MVSKFLYARKFVGTDDVMKENIVAKFDDSFALEVMFRTMKDLLVLVI